MLNRILDFSLKNKLIVILFTITVAVSHLGTVYTITVCAGTKEGILKAVRKLNLYIDISGASVSEILIIRAYTS